MTRADGFYWVQTKYGDWTIARFSHGDDCAYWEVPGKDWGHDDDDFRDIDERRIERAPSDAR